MIKRCLTSALVVLSACGTQPQSGPVVRLVAGASDTVVVNSRHPTTLAVRALDAGGRVVVGAPISYSWAGGDSLPVTSSGAVTCSRTGDFVVRAIAKPLAKRLTLQCRVVEYVRIPGPLQFILGDSVLSRPFAIPLTAFDTNGRPIAPVVASILVKDSAIVVLRGRTLFPRARGITGVGAHIGDRDAWIGVHVYQRVNSLAALDTLLRVSEQQRLFAIPIRLNAGDLLRQRLPPGEWMLTMLPEADTTPERIHLRVEGARCTDHLLNSPRRWGCQSGPEARVVLYRRSGRAPVDKASGYLLVRWLFS